MVAAGMWLVYAGVVWRVALRYAELPQRGWVLGLLGLYGLLLLAQPHERVAITAERSASWRRRLAVVYLVVQTGLVVAMFAIPPHVDFFAGLFIPLSLQAVLSLGRRSGFATIAIFPLVMFGPLTANEKGWLFALVMSAFAGGLCFLFGSYADQVQRAEAARRENQRLLGELQEANHRLMGYSAQRTELAAEQERGRLARELHDSVTQTVFGMNLTVQSACLLVARDPGRAAEQLVHLEGLGASAMSEIQMLVSQLRPAPVAEEGLPSAVRQLAAERQVRDRLQVLVEVSGERPLAPAVAAAVYRVVQEALSNVAKHGGISEATVRLNLDEEPLWVEITDRGVGFDLQTVRDEGGHLGLVSMAERAHEIGWNLSIDSHPGLGTRIRVAESSTEAAG